MMSEVKAFVTVAYYVGCFMGGWYSKKLWHLAAAWFVLTALRLGFLALIS